MTTADAHLSTGAMALDALDADEAAEFTRHLSECDSCSAEMTGFYETAALLGSAAAQPAPRSLRDAVLARIHTTAQLPPERSRTTAAAAKADRRWFARPASWAAAAAAVVAIGVVTTVVVRQEPAPQTMAACVAEATDANVIQPAVGTAGEVRYSSSCGGATIAAAALPTLPEGQVYQLWVLRGTQARSMGASAPSSAPVLDRTVAIGAGDTDIAITIEPGPTGSPQPTNPPMWVAHL